MNGVYQLIDILTQVTGKCIDCRWLAFRKLSLPSSMLPLLMAEMPCWVLFCKSMPSLQLLEPRHVPRACSLPQPLSFAATVISKTSHHCAWGRWKMKRPPCGRLDCSRLTFGFVSQANVSSQVEVCSKIVKFHGWDFMAVDPPVILSGRFGGILLHSSKESIHIFMKIGQNKWSFFISPYESA